MKNIPAVFLKQADIENRCKMQEYIEERHGISPRTFARSILSKPIDVYFVGEGKKYITVFASHHALESICTNIAFLLIDTLMENKENGMINGINCKILLSKYCFVIVPCVNPDGIEMRLNGIQSSPLSDRQMRMSGGDLSSWQANARGIDLNHNYDFAFAEYKAIEREKGINAGPSLYSGEYPESEPETHGVANLIRTLSPIAVISLHSQGEEILAYPKNKNVKRCAERLSSMCGYKVSEAVGTASYGGLCDYTGSLGIPSFTYEVGKGENPLPEQSIPDIFARICTSLISLPALL